MMRSEHSSPRHLDIAMRYLFILLLFGVGRVSASDIISQDAYARFDEQTKVWTIGTSLVEEKLRLAHGTYIVIGFQNKLSHRQYVSDRNGSEEFGITVNGKTYSGASGAW